MLGLRRVVSPVYWIVLLGATIFFYILNLLTPLKGDDVMYSLELGNVSHHIDGWDSLLRSQYFHYFDNNGRFANFLTQVFCGIIGKPLFNVFNAIVTAVFLHASASIVAGRQGSVLALSLVIAFVMTLMPVPGETMLWLCGSFNYLWAVTAALVLIRWIHTCHSGRAPWWKHCLVLAAAVLAGAMNESTTACTLLALFIFFALNRERLSALVITALVGYAIGVAVIFASPAMWNRLDAGGDVNLHISTAQLISRRLINTCTKSVHFVTPVIAMVGIVVALFRRRFSQLKGNFMVWAFLSAAVMIVVLSITTSYRTYTTFALFSFMLVAQWLHGVVERRRWSVPVACVLLLACAVLAVPAVSSTYVYKQYDDRVTQAIVASPRQCILPASHSPVKSRWVFPAVYDNEGYFGHKHFYCCYYGKDNLQFLAPDIYARYQSGKMMQGGVPAPFAPADTTFKAVLMTFPGHPYSIIEMSADSLSLSHPHAKVYYYSMEEHIGQERTARLKRWGEMPDYMPMSQYVLQQGGHSYVVLPELEHDVKAIETAFTINGEERIVKFERKSVK